MRRLTDEGRNRVSHGQDVDRAHRLARGQRRAWRPPAAEWVRLLDGGGRLLALAGDAASRSPRALHPAVVLI